MIKSLLTAALGLALASSAAAKPGDDVAAPVRQFVDGFNSGHIAAAFAAYAPGTISIIDEFAPFHWTGPDAARAWAAGYDRNARANGISGGVVHYQSPTRVERGAGRAYVIMPTDYRYTQRGQAMAETGQLTAVVVRTQRGWKMTGWTWSGEPPHPAR